MTMKHYSGFSTDATGELVGYITTGSFYNFYEVPGGQYFIGFSASIDFETYDNVLTSLQSTINTIFSPETVSISYDFSLDRIVLSSSFNTTNFKFNQALQRILGFEQSYTNTKIITGSNQPWYTWSSTNDYRSSDTEIYENNQIFEERVADSGRSYSVGNDKTSNYRDWVFGNEPKENLYEQFALNTVPFTYDLFLKNLRKGPYPFVIFDSLNVSSLDYSQRDGTYEMRAEATKFVPKQKFEDYYDYWDISLKTRLLSRPNQNQSNNFSTLTTTGSFAGYDIPGLIVWLNASKGGTFNADMTLRQVTDQSSYGSVSADNASSLIYLSASNTSWSNKSVYHMTASTLTDNTTVLSNASTVLNDTPTGATMCLIGEFIGNSVDSGFRSAFALRDNITATIFFIGSNYNNTLRRIVWAPYDGNLGLVNTFTSSQIPLNQKFIAVGTWDQSSFTGQLFVNGNDFATGIDLNQGSQAGMSTDINWNLNIFNPSSSPMPDMNVAEVLTFDRVLSNENINILLNYANVTYGITSSYLAT